MSTETKSASEPMVCSDEGMDLLRDVINERRSMNDVRIFIVSLEQRLEEAEKKQDELKALSGVVLLGTDKQTIGEIWERVRDVMDDARRYREVMPKVVAALKYMRLSTAPGGQWENRNANELYGFIDSILIRIEASTPPAAEPRKKKRRYFEDGGEIYFIEYGRPYHIYQTEENSCVLASAIEPAVIVTWKELTEQQARQLVKHWPAELEGAKK